MAHHRREAVLAVQHMADRPRARCAHRLAAIATVTCCVHLTMDSTLHRVLPSIRTEKFPLRMGSSSASIWVCELTSFARFCWRGVAGGGPSVRPGDFFGVGFGD